MQAVTITQITLPELGENLSPIFEASLRKVLSELINPNSFRESKPLRLKAAADFIGVAETTLYSLVHQGKLKPLKPGGHLLFTKESLQAYLRGERPEQEVNEDPSTYLKRNKKGGIK